MTLVTLEGKSGPLGKLKQQWQPASKKKAGISEKARPSEPFHLVNRKPGANHSSNKSKHIHLLWDRWACKLQQACGATNCAANACGLPCLKGNPSGLSTPKLSLLSLQREREHAFSLALCPSFSFTGVGKQVN